MLRLVVGIAHRLDVIEQNFGRSQCHGFRSGVVGKQAGGNLIDPLVCALCRKHHSHQQFEVVAVVEFRFGIAQRAR